MGHISLCTERIAAKYKTTMNTPPPKADRILEIARAIAAKTFAAKSTEKKVTPTKEVADHIIRGPGTAEIIRNPDYDTVYSMNIERKYVTRYNLNRISSEMVKMAGHKTVSVKSLVRTLRECLKVICHPYMLDTYLFCIRPLFLAVK